MSFVSTWGSAQHSLRLAEIKMKAAVFTALATAASWVTMSSQLRPSSSIRTMAPICPRALGAFGDRAQLPFVRQDAKGALSSEHLKKLRTFAHQDLKMKLQSQGLLTHLVKVPL